MSSAKKYIYYTGVGAKPDGKHTVDEFMQIMNKQFKADCSWGLAKKEYHPCAKFAKMRTDEIINKVKNPSYKRTKKEEAKFKKYDRMCNKRKSSKKNRTCNFNEYIEYSGAEMK
jgi:hypothetical protein